MKPSELKSLCDLMCAGNVSKFVKLMGITRTAYYRSVNADAVHDQTAHKIQVKLYEMQTAPQRLDDLEARIDALEAGI